VHEDEVDAFDERLLEDVLLDVLGEGRVPLGAHAGRCRLVDHLLQDALDLLLQLEFEAAAAARERAVPSDEADRRGRVDDGEQQQFGAQLGGESDRVADLGLAGLREVDGREDATHDRNHHAGDPTRAHRQFESGPAILPRLVDLEKLAIERRPKTNRRRNPWPLRLTLFALVGLSVWLFGGPVMEFVDRVRLPVVRTFVVSEAPAAAAAQIRGTAANGYVVAARRAALSSDVPGRIIELNVREGSVVKQGDVVARLFADEFAAAWRRSEADAQAAENVVQRAEAQHKVVVADVVQAEQSFMAAEAQREEARAQVSFAIAEFDRIAELHRQGIEGQNAVDRTRSARDAAQARLDAETQAAKASAAATDAARQRLAVAAADVDVARAQWAAAKAQAEQARATLDKTDVRAPFDGIVVLKDAEVGEVVSPNVQGGSTARGAVCTMVDFDSLEVQANVPETTLSSVQLGAPADVFLDAFPDDRIPGRVDRIWPTADRQKATVEVRVELLERSERLRPEMGVRVVFRQSGEADPATTAGARRRIVVPEQAIVQVDGKTGAFVLERDTVRFAAIEAGDKKSGRVAVEAGLEVNQRIVLDPPASLKSGDRVRLGDQ
jgi:HlyD family secretion protein